MADQQNDPWAEPVEKPRGRRPRDGRPGGVDSRLLSAAAVAIIAVAAVVVVIASGGSGKSSGSNLASNTSTRSSSTTSSTASSGASGAGVNTNFVSVTTGKSATTGAGGSSTGGGTPTTEVSAASNPKEWGELFDLYTNFELWAEGDGGSPSSMFTATVTQTGLTSPRCGTVNGIAALAAAYSHLGGATVNVNTPDSFPVAGGASDFTASVSIGSRTVRVHFDTAEFGRKWLISAISGPCV